MLSEEIVYELSLTVAGETKGAEVIGVCSVWRTALRMAKKE
jgi:hypothetical protein